jgi:hypothetical protein
VSFSEIDQNLSVLQGNLGEILKHVFLPELSKCMEIKNLEQGRQEKGKLPIALAVSRGRYWT